MLFLQIHNPSSNSAKALLSGYVYHIVSIRIFIILRPCFHKPVLFFSETFVFSLLLPCQLLIPEPAIGSI